MLDDKKNAAWNLLKVSRLIFLTTAVCPSHLEVEIGNVSSDCLEQADNRYGVQGS